MSHLTPEPRSGGPVSPQSMASAAEITPMPMVRTIQMRFLVISRSQSAILAGSCSTNDRQRCSQSAVTSYGWPPTRMQFSVSRAPQYSS